LNHIEEGKCNARLTPECWDDLPHLDWSYAGELAEGELHVIEGLAHNQQDDDVGNEKGATTVCVGGEGKTPHIAQANRHGDAGHEELDRAGPLLPVWRFFLS